MHEQHNNGEVTVAMEDVRKADTKSLVVTGTEAFPEDEFSGIYLGSEGSDQYAPIIEPMYKPGTLHALCTQNNILGVCIEAMEVNIEGTGHSIVLKDGMAEAQAEKTLLEDFFNEPYPGKTMKEIRRAIRTDREETGNGYLEVLRTGDGEVVMINHLPAENTRLVRLGEPVPVERGVTRAGKELKVTMMSRERRYCQMVNGRKVFYKQFGASRDLDKETGRWAEQGVKLPIDKRASEVIHFSLKREPNSPYGVPRWVSQMPSVLGSRKAEEFNLEFFDAGGIPPAMIIIEGGYLGTDVKKEIRQQAAAKGSTHRLSIVEAISSSGSLDSAGSVRVRVERFGSDRQNDSMFQQYDKNCEEHIRVAFRLPPLFVGKAADFNFATAYTAYMVAEAQVFVPEREMFDEEINNTIVKALGVKNYRFSSLPLTLVDVANQLKALEMVKGLAISGEELVKKLNEVVGMNLEYEKQEEPAPASEPAPAPTPNNDIDRGIEDVAVPAKKMEKALQDLGLLELHRCADELCCGGGA